MKEEGISTLDFLNMTSFNINKIERIFYLFSLFCILFGFRKLLKEDKKE